MRTFLSVALVTGFLTLVAGHSFLKSQVPYDEHHNEKPIQIVRLTPKENVTLSNPQVNVSASFDLLRGSVPIVPLSLELIIDGVNVTKQSQITATDDIPASQAEILFQPPQPFSPGKHVVELRFANNQNQQFSYTWNFFVSK